MYLLVGEGGGENTLKKSGFQNICPNTSLFSWSLICLNKIQNTQLPFRLSLLNCDVLLFSARLPFKRLNPVPKEDANPGEKKARNSKNALDQNTTSCPDLSHPSSDNMENNCQAKTEIQFVPKLVNGRGPLDNFMQKKTKKDTSQSSLLIDLTDDSDYKLNDLGNNISNKVAPFVEKTNEEIGSKLVQSGSQEFSCNTQVDVLVETCPMTVDKDELLDMFTEKEISSVKESDLKNVVFERKMPVVVLEDIMSARSLQPAPLEKSLLSGNEMVDSFPEEDTPCTNSSLSSLSSTSSPESLPTQECNSPLAASTPFRKVSAYDRGSNKNGKDCVQIKELLSICVFSF